MKILLLSLPSARKEIPKFPLGLACIASYLRGHAVKAADLNVAEEPAKELARLIGKEEPDLIGAGFPYADTCSSYNRFSYFPNFVRYVKKIKKIKKDVPLVTGGAGFTLFAERIMRLLPEIDMGVLSEGEETFGDLLENLSSPGKVSGICYRKDLDVAFTRERDFADFGSLPSPKREILDLSPYRHFPEQIGVQTKRGCAFGCVYCTYPYVGGNRVRTRSAQKVAEELGSLERAGIKDVFINDSIFNHPGEHAEEVCRKIIENRIRVSWKAFFNERFMDRQIFLLAKEAGCRTFIFGPDGGHPRTLNRIKKNFGFGEMERAYSLFTRKDTARIKCAFMFNGPGENLRTAFSTLRLIAGLFFSKNFSFEIVNQRIYPHTELYSISLKKGIITKETDLMRGVYYNPMPLGLVSLFINFAGKILYTIKRLMQYRRSRKRT